MAKILQEKPQGVLPSNTVPNPREQINSITTRSGLTTVEPSIPHHVPPTPKEGVEKEPETLMDEVHTTSPTRAAWTWLEKEPPNSIMTWNDLVSKFMNQFFPPSRTTNLRNEITIFQQKFDETFT
nr:reverse transcriptase domain-containing protein [Tanacetum cinerariifolium]